MPIWNGVGGGVVFNSSSSFFSPMRAWLEQPHGRHHKAPPQPCALTTSRSASGGVFRTAGARTGNSPPSSSFWWRPAKRRRRRPRPSSPFFSYRPFPKQQRRDPSGMRTKPQGLLLLRPKAPGGQGGFPPCKTPAKKQAGCPAPTPPKWRKNTTGATAGNYRHGHPRTYPRCGQSRARCAVDGSGSRRGDSASRALQIEVRRVGEWRWWCAEVLLPQMAR